MEPDFSLSCAQYPAISPYRDQNKFSLHPLTLVL
jgi:hypothetical protein